MLLNVVDTAFHFREYFAPRIADESVIPILLDDSKFLGVPADIVGIRFNFDPADPARTSAIFFLGGSHREVLLETYFSQQRFPEIVEPTLSLKN